jgi:hypothetical protein
MIQRCRDFDCAQELWLEIDAISPRLELLEPKAKGLLWGMRLACLEGGLEAWLAL